MRVIIEVEVADEFVDTDERSGVTDAGYRLIHQALMGICEIQDVVSRDRLFARKDSK